LRRLAAGLALLGLLFFDPPVDAHALLRRSVPAGGAVLRQSPDAVAITFTEEPEPTLSVIHVLDSAGRRLDTNPTRSVPGQPLVLSVPLGPLPKGVYTVSWRTVSRVDGHVTGGTFGFGIGVAPTEAIPPEAVANPAPSVPAVLGKWALYVGLIGLLGAGWVWGLAFRVPPQATKYLWLPWLLSVAGLIGLGEAQAGAAGVTVGRILGTAIGTALWARAAPLAASAIAVAVVLRSSGSRQHAALVAVALCAAAAMLAHVLAGHAGATTDAWRWANVIEQWGHFLGVGAWIGGLGALLAGVGSVPSPEKTHMVRRFSTVALFAVSVVALTGTIRAISEVGTWQALLSTDFGRLVLVKAGLLLVLVAIGAVNRFRNVPAAVTTLLGLRRLGATELAVAAATLGITAVLTGIAPASFLQQPGPPRVAIATGNDFATSVRVQLEAIPGQPGPNRFITRIVDYDTGRPVAADRVTLRFTKPDRSDIAATLLTLSRSGAGIYQAQGINLSMGGAWNVAVVVEQGAHSVEVPLALSVSSPPQRVRTIEAPGQPTLYSIDLPGERVLDAYLDPGKPGFNEVHATFIDAKGGELPIPRPAAITATRQGGAAQPLVVRRFGPGHFIADATLGPGDWQIDVTATASDGATLEARFPVHLR
jgi:copper transport protein